MRPKVLLDLTFPLHHWISPALGNCYRNNNYSWDLFSCLNLLFPDTGTSIDIKSPKHDTIAKNH